MIDLESGCESDNISGREELKEYEAAGTASDAIGDSGCDLSFVELAYPAGE